MNQVLFNIEGIDFNLSFLKKHLSVSVFGHVTEYVSGLIGLENKSVKGVSDASLKEKSHDGIAYALLKSKFPEDDVVDSYYKKLGYLSKRVSVFVLLLMIIMLSMVVMKFTVLIIISRIPVLVMLRVISF